MERFPLTLMAMDEALGRGTVRASMQPGCANGSNGLKTLHREALVAIPSHIYTGLDTMVELLLLMPEVSLSPSIHRIQPLSILSVFILTLMKLCQETGKGIIKSFVRIRRCRTIESCVFCISASNLSLIIPPLQ